MSTYTALHKINAAGNILTYRRADTTDNTNYSHGRHTVVCFFRQSFKLKPPVLIFDTKPIMTL